MEKKTCSELSRLEEKKMVPTLEAIKGGGGSIKVGTTGTISTLMSRELESKKPATQTQVSSRNKSPTVSISVPSGIATTTKKLKPRTSLDEASSSSSNKKSSEIARKTKHYNRKTNQIPMLDSENISLDGSTPIRDKPDKRGSYIAEVVDIKCGNQDRTWASPITSRLKKLGFSKLSESII